MHKPESMEKQELLQILSEFVSPVGLLEARALSGGHINQTLKVEAVLAGGRREKYVLQKINTSIFKAPERVMENIANAAEGLSGTDYRLKVMKPYQTKSGSWLWATPEGVWRLYPFFENTICLLTVQSDETAGQTAWAFGHFIGKLSAAEAGKFHSTIPDFHNGLLRIQQLQQAAKAAKKNRLLEAQALLKEMSEHFEFLKKADTLPMPLRVAHHDAKCSNVLFDAEKKKPVAIIDLDTVMPGRIISDFGDLVRSLSSTVSEEAENPAEVEFLPGRYKVLEGNFLEGLAGGISAEEKAALPVAGPWLTLMQSIRFLTDYLQGDPYYRVSHERQNYARALNQFVLFKSMRRQLAAQINSVLN